MNNIFEVFLRHVEFIFEAILVLTPTSKVHQEVEPKIKGGNFKNIKIRNLWVVEVIFEVVF